MLGPQRLAQGARRHRRWRVDVDGLQRGFPAASRVLNFPSSSVSLLEIADVARDGPRRDTKLIPRGQFRAAARQGTLNGARAQHTEQDGTPYGMARFDLLHDGLPCLEGPWSTLVAVDLDRGEVLWGAAPWHDPPGRRR